MLHKSQTKICFLALNIQLFNTRMEEYKQKHVCKLETP